jgi:phosphoribosyl-AMP cyclohydrolase / phosphoribosyl-ATP pyrophosphohydrolase
VWIEQIRFDDRGLVPVVAQDATTGDVLMLAYADREALLATRDTGLAHYFSRSRGSLWRKGETSGNVQHVREIRIDCDADAVLYRVAQTGPACHTGAASCFFRTSGGEEDPDAAQEPAHVLDRLASVVAERAVSRPAGSYTTYLFEQGLDKILKKLGEETTETVIAAKNGDPDEMVAESADLLFHLLVMLRDRDIPLRRIWDEVERRWGAAPRERTGRPVDRDT